MVDINGGGYPKNRPFISGHLLALLFLFYWPENKSRHFLLHFCRAQKWRSKMKGKTRVASLSCFYFSYSRSRWKIGRLSFIFPALFHSLQNKEFRPLFFFPAPASKIIIDPQLMMRALRLSALNFIFGPVLLFLRSFLLGQKYNSAASSASLRSWLFYFRHLFFIL